MREYTKTRKLENSMCYDIRILGLRFKSSVVDLDILQAQLLTSFFQFYVS